MRARVMSMVVLTATVSGCAVIPSRALRTDETLVRGRAVEGYLVVAASPAGMRPDTDLLGGYLCLDGDLNRCVVFGPQASSEGYRAYALPPGTWCVTEVWVQNGDFYRDVPVDRARYQCFPVVENAVTYPGHVDIVTEKSQFPGSAQSAVAFEGVAGAREQAVAKYPALADLEWTTPVMAPLQTPAGE